MDHCPKCGWAVIEVSGGFLCPKCQQQHVEQRLRHPIVEDAFPYRKYRATLDDRVRATHLILESSGLNGSPIYNKDDPVWLAFAPPWEAECRCAFSPMTIKKAAEYGVQEAIDWLNRAKAIAIAHGGMPAQYFTLVAPPEFQAVPWPTLDGQLIIPPHLTQELR